LAVERLGVLLLPVERFAVERLPEERDDDEPRDDELRLDFGCGMNLSPSSDARHAIAADKGASFGPLVEPSGVSSSYVEEAAGGWRSGCCAPDQPLSDRVDG
jgi:hypothetical protein